MLDWFAKRRSPKRMARDLYARIVAQSRLPVFYAELGVPDEVEKRFELLALHMFVGLRRLRQQGGEASGVAQRLVDLFVADMDAAMREMGVGDMAVPKKVRAVAAAFRSRLQVYEAAAAGDDRRALEGALGRYLLDDEAHRSAPLLADYALRALDLPAPLAPVGGADGEPLFPDVRASA